MTANIRTPQRTVSAMQRFAVSQKNRTEAITISAFSLSLLYSAKNREFSTLRCKNRRRPTEIECRLFCCPILLGRCRFCSFLKLLSYRHTAYVCPFFLWMLQTVKYPQRSKLPAFHTLSKVLKLHMSFNTVPILWLEGRAGMVRAS